MAHKQDVLVLDPDTDAAVRAALAKDKPDETDVDFVARTLIAALLARRPERARRGYHLIQATPALEARIYQLVWRDQEGIVQALLARGTARRRPYRPRWRSIPSVSKSRRAASMSAMFA